jgi:predicted ATPase|uniref:AAA family ATPase n=1 Tax=Polaribacter sp. TaxID=1920175 RepID=UPI0040479361
MQQKIVLIGGPGTGKSSVLNELMDRGHFCMPEISREVILEAKKKGIDQLFLADPLLFSNLLLEGREQQFIKASKKKKPFVFFDRGIPDVFAYLNFLESDYPEHFISKSKEYIYHKVFMLPPWKEIYTSDNERYESFEQAVTIHNHLMHAYHEIGYQISTVPFGSVKDRANYILNSLQSEL